MRSDRIRRVSVSAERRSSLVLSLLPAHALRVEHDKVVDIGLGLRVMLLSARGNRGRRLLAVAGVEADGE